MQVPEVVSVGVVAVFRAHAGHHPRGRLKCDAVALAVASSGARLVVKHRHAEPGQNNEAESQQDADEPHRRYRPLPREAGPRLPDPTAALHDMANALVGLRSGIEAEAPLERGAALGLREHCDDP